MSKVGHQHTSLEKQTSSPPGSGSKQVADILHHSILGDTAAMTSLRRSQAQLLVDPQMTGATNSTATPFTAGSNQQQVPSNGDQKLDAAPAMETDLEDTGAANPEDPVTEREWDEVEQALAAGAGSPDAVGCIMDSTSSLAAQLQMFHQQYHAMARLQIKTMKNQAVMAKDNNKLLRQALYDMNSKGQLLSKTVQDFTEAANWTQQVHNLNMEVRVLKHAYETVHNQLMEAQNLLQEKERDYIVARDELEYIQRQANSKANSHKETIDMLQLQLQQVQADLQRKDHECKQLRSRINALGDDTHMHDAEGVTGCSTPSSRGSLDQELLAGPDMLHHLNELTQPTHARAKELNPIVKKMFVVYKKQEAKLKALQDELDRLRAQHSGQEQHEAPVLKERQVSDGGDHLALLQLATESTDFHHQPDPQHLARIAELESFVQTLEAQLQSTKEQAQRAQENHQQQMAEVQQTITALRQELEEGRKSEHGKVKELEGSIDTLRSKLQAAHAEVEKYKQELEQQKQQGSSQVQEQVKQSPKQQRKVVTQLEEQLRQLQLDLEAATRDRQQLQEGGQKLEGGAEQLRSQLKAAEEKAQAAAASAVSLEGSLQSEREMYETVVEELQQAQQRLAKLQSENSNLTRELSMLRECMETERMELESAHEEQQWSAQHLEAAQAKIKELEQQMTAAQKGLEQAEATAAAAQKAAAQADARVAAVKKRSSVAGLSEGSSPSGMATPTTGTAPAGTSGAAELASKLLEAQAQVSALEQELAATQQRLSAFVTAARESCQQELDDIANNQQLDSAAKSHERQSVLALVGLLHTSEAMHTKQDRQGSLARIRMLQAQLEHVLESALDPSNQSACRAAVEEANKMMARSMPAEAGVSQTGAGASQGHAPPDPFPDPALELMHAHQEHSFHHDGGAAGGADVPQHLDLGLPAGAPEPSTDLAAELDIHDPMYTGGAWWELPPQAPPPVFTFGAEEGGAE